MYDLYKRQGWVVAVPEVLRQAVIEECHNDGAHGYRGVTKTLWAIRQRYFFKKMKAAVSRFVSNCVTCVRSKSSISGRDLPLVPMVATRPFNVIVIDLYSPGEVVSGGWKYVLTVVDLCTRWVQFIPLCWCLKLW